MLILDDLLTGQNPRSEKNVQIFALHLPAEGRKSPNVRDEKPARDILNLAQGPLYHVRFVYF